MPLDKLVLILVIAIAAAGVTVFLGAWVAASGALPGLGIATALPVALLAYVLVRVIRDRMRAARDEPYDKVEK